MQHKYVGPAHAPAFDAVWSAQVGVNPETSKSYVGRDGLTWKLVD
jgi:hypothetical protein